MALIAVLVTAAIGILTNVVTDSFTWTAAVVLALLIVAAGVLAWLQTGTATRRSVRQRATRAGVIRRSPIRLRGAGEVSDRADRHGRIERSKVDNAGGRVERRASGGGVIDRSDIEID
ncbi:hypothetical protein AB0H83_19420 [Dactylosporangium sp. NPDC050688]|uniref:hypothetical protein n=1 Tax=Dactylosporangium sp. NPDC050688 TaxID=3157217 RepID=UPI0033C7A701